MSRSLVGATLAVLAFTSLAGCQATKNLIDGPEAEEEVIVVEQEPSTLPAYTPTAPPYQQPIYQSPGQPGFYPQAPYGQPQPVYGQTQQVCCQQPVVAGPPQIYGSGPVPYGTVGYGQTGYGPAGYPQQVNRPPLDPEMFSRGEYLVQIGGCTECHTDGALSGQPMPNRYLAGSHTGIEVEGLGIMYAPNITPDPGTGIGNWSVQDIVRSLRSGIRPDGTTLRPPMPIANISRLTEQDATAIAVYLQNIRPIYHQTNRNPVSKSRANYPYFDHVRPSMRSSSSSSSNSSSSSSSSDSSNGDGASTESTE
jgi:mono/diheme cytochrome c family protein